MKCCKLHNREIAFVAYAFLIISAVVSRAAVVDLRKAIDNESSLIHHFSFEGPREDTNSPRLDDKAGTSRLTETFNGGATSPLYESGMDSLSRGGAPRYLDGTFGTGSAWRTTNAIALPSTMTVECLFRPDELPDHETYVLGTRDATNQRGYYIRQSDGGNLETRVGEGAYRPIVSSFETGHWYYVVSTYSVSAGKTTINSYYADLTAGDELQHSIVDEVENGTYGSSAMLGVGCLSLVTSQYFAPCTIDEVAMYNSVLDEDDIKYHLSELKQDLPVVEYREIFPNDTYTAQRYFPQEGWKAHRGTNGIHTVSPVIEEWNTAFDENVQPIASFPSDTGVTQGYLNNHSGPTDTNYLYWTEEMTNQIDVSWLKQVRFDARFVETRDISFALRVDTNSTPANTADDIWFYGRDFDKDPGTSAISILSSGDNWHSYWFEPGTGEWATLDFEEASHLIAGITEVSLPTNGLVTAIGLFEEYHKHTKNERFDNLSLYVRRVYPPPPPQGTILLIQ